MAEALGLDRPGGVVVTAVHPASPFVAAGVQPGDVVRALQGAEVFSPSELHYRMSLAGIGRSAEALVVSRGQERSVRIAMIAPPEVPARDTRVLSRSDVLPGLAVANANPAVAEEMGLPLEISGVVVFDPGPYGARVGLRPGDILREIDGQRIARPGDVRQALRQAGNRVELVAQRGGQRLILRFRV